MIQVGTLWSPSFRISKIICGWHKIISDLMELQIILIVMWSRKWRQKQQWDIRLNRGLKHRFRCCDSSFYSRNLHVWLLLTSVFRVDFLFHTVGAWALTLANRWQQRLVQHSWVLQHVLQVLSVPRHHNSDAQQRLAEVEPADNHTLTPALVKLHYQTNEDGLKGTPVRRTSPEVGGHLERGRAVVDSHVWRVSPQVRTWGWRRGAPLMHSPPVGRS